MILSRVSPVTHSIGNCVKRVAVIVASLIIFQNPISTQNAAGVGSKQTSTPKVLCWLACHVLLQVLPLRCLGCFCTARSSAATQSQESQVRVIEQCTGYCNRLGQEAQRPDDSRDIWILFSMAWSAASLFSAESHQEGSSKKKKMVTLNGSTNLVCCDPCQPVAL